jgi:hypothetical protein
VAFCLRLLLLFGGLFGSFNLAAGQLFGSLSGGSCRLENCLRLDDW